ncbi:unnamed protein product [Arabidopsis lyrata]|uniref:Expressed protein n=1 Tax=Arabidopsis lyrata subsp. lyrata TaxID=81972 RepID=D7MVV2_ARALL|nr:expressed protein [Arabidopsis lyrata subsp. lyrata]CAH8278954.1 unnamed protein product [Arabidopsis lyrata]
MVSRIVSIATKLLFKVAPLFSPSVRAYLRPYHGLNSSVMVSASFRLRTVSIVSSLERLCSTIIESGFLI